MNCVIEVAGVARVDLNRLSAVVLARAAGQADAGGVTSTHAPSDRSWRRHAGLPTDVAAARGEQREEPDRDRSVLCMTMPPLIS